MPESAITPPYLLFLGRPDFPDTIKTASGIARWRPELCAGEWHLDGGDRSITTGQPQRTPEEAARAGAKSMVLGSVNAGGRLASEWADAIERALRVGLDVVSGMHERLRGIPRLADAARQYGRRLLDIRVPPAGIPVGTAEPRSGHRVLTVGTDCNIGKMWTTLAIEKALRERGCDATFRATGQTGILVAGGGIPVDAVVSDFVSGAIEQLAPAAADDHWDVIEGQGSLFHPSFAAVTLGLIHGAQAEHLVMCHQPGRKQLRTLPTYPLPSLSDCIRANEDAARLTAPSAKVVAVALNTVHLADREAERACAEARDETGLPAVDPIRHGAGVIAETLLAR